MASLMKVPLEDGSTIVIEVGETELGTVPAGRAGDIAAEANKTLERAMDDIVRGSQAVLGKLREIAPDEVEVEFGITITAEVGAIFAKTGGEATFGVKLTWKRGAAEE